MKAGTQPGRTKHGQSDGLYVARKPGAHLPGNAGRSFGWRARGHSQPNSTRGNAGSCIADSPQRYHQYESIASRYIPDGQQGGLGCGRRLKSLNASTLNSFGRDLHA